MKKLILMRGVPGSGKSTLAKKLLEEHPSPLKAICSTDDFRCYGDGVYKYDGKQNGFMHGKNRDRALSYAKLGFDLIIVDNTNTTWREMKPYVLIAILFDYEIELVESDTEWAFNLDECTKRNQHSVPRESIETMLNRYTSNGQLRTKIDKLRKECA